MSAPITGRPVRVGLVGCGRISQKHVEAFAGHPGKVELVAAADTDPAALKAFVEKTGVRGFDSLTALLAGSDADAVVLCTPSGLHAEETVQAAAAGRHVITEKPMATRWEDGRRMVQACDRAGVRLFVVKQNRRNPTLQLLKRAVDGGRFGRIHAVQVNVFWNRPQSYYDSAAWRGTWEFDGGALMNQASHYIDLLEWLIGPVESVHAFTATLARNIQVEDSGVAVLRWRSGALGALNVSMLTWPRNLEGSITVLGETGTVRVGGVAVNRIEHWAFADAHPDDALVEKANYETESVYGHGHVGYYDNVLATLRGEAQPDTDGREGLKSLELLVALYQSARNGRPVGLPLEL